MTIYILLWSFAIVDGSTYVETPHVFTSMEACTTKLTDMQYDIKEGKGECQRAVVAKE